MVHLIPLQENELQSYLDKTIPNYAAEKVKAGYWTDEEGLQKSRDSFDRLLPDGVNTKNQYLFQIEDSETNQRMGII